MKPRIVVTEPLPLIDKELEILSTYSDVSVLNSVNEDVIAEAARHADIIMVVYAKITRKIIENAVRLKGIVRYGIGIDNIDIKAASERNVMVVNVPDYGIKSVADHTMALILTLVRKILAWDKYTRERKYSGRWTAPPMELIGIELADKMLGLIGFGKIGREVAKRARAFDMKILVYDPYIPKDIGIEWNVRLVELDELLKESDFVSIHCPLTKETYHLINEDKLRVMKKTAYLINTARGPIVDEKALYKALKERWIAGAALDVFEYEPLPSDSPLFELDNIIMTPHIAWFTEEALKRLEFTACEEAIRILKGETPRNLVNREILSRK